MKFKMDKLGQWSKWHWSTSFGTVGANHAERATESISSRQLPRQTYKARLNSSKNHLDPVRLTVRTFTTCWRSTIIIHQMKRVTNEVILQASCCLVSIHCQEFSCVRKNKISHHLNGLRTRK